MEQHPKAETVKPRIDWVQEQNSGRLQGPVLAHWLQSLPENITDQSFAFPTARSDTCNQVHGTTAARAFSRIHNGYGT